MGNSAAQSIALGVSGDGTTTVGHSSTVHDSFQTHAVKWTAAGIADLGTLPGGYQSSAAGVNHDGSIVVGWSTGSGFANMHAFRWTPKAGMRDLNTLLVAAGVNMTGIVLTRANAISENGQFIVGSARFGDTERAYLVRYLEAPSDTPIEGPSNSTIAGTTEIISVQQSIDDLSHARRSAAVHQHGFAAPLLGGDKPMRQSNDIAAFGSVGSLAAGAAARFAFGDRITILGGLSYTQEDYQNTELRNATTGALALRYIHTDFGVLQPFVEGGGWLTPHASMRFTRSYANGAGLASGVGSTESKMTYAFGRVGVAVDIDKNNQLSLSGEYGRQRMSISGYTEPLSSANPFEAHVPGGTDASDLLKARAQYTVNFTDHVDTTLWAGAVRTVNVSSGLTAVVAGIGTLTPHSNAGTIWAEYGARVGYKISGNLTFDVFSGGISGRDGIGTKVHSGAGVRFRF